MHYQIFAKRWRPQRFSDVIGQDVEVRVLQNGLREGRVHHAYLFTGTRGVGKTSLARILAKALNCLAHVAGEPCNQCAHCDAHHQGAFPDLIEIDAASRTKVEDTRAVLETVMYAPMMGRYKIYLIDEVHMLSAHSFNALLKTLEEPPEHIKFLLATTEPQKLPMTIVSRCLQFPLRCVSVEKLYHHFETILKQDSIAYEPAGVWLIAEAARGSVRDGLSLLEQAVLLSVGCMTGISAAGVRSQLGCGSERDIWSLLAAIAHSDVRAVLALSQQLSDQSVDFIEVLSQLLHALYQLALYQQVPDVSLTLALDLQPMLKQLALEVPPEAVQLYYQIALLAEDDLKRAPDFKMGFEMALLRMLAFAPQSGGGSTVPPPLQSDPLIAPIMPNQPVSAPLKPASTVPRDTTITEYQSTAGDQNWSEWIETLGLHGLALSLLRHTQKIEQDAQTLRLALAPQAASLLNQNTQQAIEMAVRRFLGESIQVQIEVAASASTIETPAKTHQAAAVLHQEEVRADMQRNPHIQAILDAFNGELKVDSI